MYNKLTGITPNYWYKNIYSRLLGIKTWKDFWEIIYDDKIIYKQFLGRSVYADNLSYIKKLCSILFHIICMLCPVNLQVIYL